MTVPMVAYGCLIRQSPMIWDPTYSSTFQYRSYWRGMGVQAGLESTVRNDTNKTLNGSFDVLEGSGQSNLMHHRAGG